MNQQKPSKILNHIHKSYDLPVYAYDAWLVFLQGFCWIAYEKAQCFYHSDHASTSLSTGLGSASWITVRQAHCNADLNGDAIQHLQYLAFGEDFVNQQSTAFDTRFKFTGKEKDSETGYSYPSTGSGRRFGARYYDSDLSVWLSVDPMAGKYPNISGYAYVFNNPLNYIDYWGLEGDPVDEFQNKKQKFEQDGSHKHGRELKRFINKHENELGMSNANYHRKSRVLTFDTKESGSYDPVDLGGNNGNSVDLGGATELVGSYHVSGRIKGGKSSNKGNGFWSNLLNFLGLRVEGGQGENYSKTRKGQSRATVDLGKLLNWDKPSKEPFVINTRRENEGSNDIFNDHGIPIKEKIESGNGLDPYELVPVEVTPPSKSGSGWYEYHQRKDSANMLWKK